MSYNKKINLELCQEWRENKLRNPITKYPISKDGTVYKTFEKECAKFDSPKKSSPQINKKTIKYFITKYIKKFDTVIDLLEHKISEDDSDLIDSLNAATGFSKTQKGFIYEKIWDICIKFGVTDFTNNMDNIMHGKGNINNINKSEFIEFKNYIDDYLNENYISGNSGGYSDITFHVMNNNIKQLNLISVKYYEKSERIDKYDIQKLCTIIDDRKNDGYDMINVMLFVKDKKMLIDKIKKYARESSNVLIKYISPNGNYENIYDTSDLEKYFLKLKKILELYDYFSNEKIYEEFKMQYLNNYKKIFDLRFHQELFIEKINDLICKNNKKILIGAIPRSGKTFIMAGTVLQHVQNNYKKNGKYNKYVIITPSPSETIQQYKEVFNNFIDFDKMNISVIEINSNLNEYNFNVQNSHIVYLVSKQRLGYINKGDKDIDDLEEEQLKKIEKNIEKYFKNDSFDIIFIDEAHFGMSTKMAQSIINILDKNNVPKVFVTATYNKPNIAYNIDEGCRISWNLHDIKLLKNTTDKNFDFFLSHFSKKFGEKIFFKVLKKNHFVIDKNYITSKFIKINENNIKNIIKPYTIFPEPFLITSIWDYDYIEKEKIKTEGTNFGFDMDKLFAPQQGKDYVFENTEQLKELFHYYFGYPNKARSYKQQIFYKERGILPRIKDICNNNCRTLQHPKHKTSQLWFLPYGQGREIKRVINSLLYFLNSYFKSIFDRHLFFVALEKVDKAYTSKNVIYMSSAKNIKKEILNLEKNLDDYDGMIILAGARLQLGISLNNVDIVSIFSGISSSDQIYQMLFRSMTEIDEDIECDCFNFCAKKKYGFMVDLNPQRTLITLNYLTEELIDNNTNNGNKIRMNILADLMNIDRDVLIDKYDSVNGVDEKFSEELFDKLYTSWDVKIENLKKVLNEITYNKEFLEKLKNYDIRDLFKVSKQSKSKTIIMEPDSDLNGKKGIISIYKKTKKQKDMKINLEEILTDIMSEVIALLTTITSYNDNECIFTLNDIDNIKLEFEINRLLEIVYKDEILKNIFLQGLKDRVINGLIIEDDDIFNLIRSIVANIQSTNKQSGGNLISLNKIIQTRKKKIYTINEPDKLLEFIQINLAPKEIEKNERGEVFTPMALVNEMLDKLPNSVWKKKEYKWLDPSAGMGNFPIAVYTRLMQSLKDDIKDDDARRKHILENMIYMVEINVKNVFLLKKILCGNTYKLNIYEGSFLDYETDKKFDIIIGNPPYQDTNDKGKRKAKNHNLWSVFIDISFNKLLKNEGYLLFITPPSWMSPSYENKEIFYENYIIFLNMKECQKYFKGVGSEFCYYLIQKVRKNIETDVICLYNKKIYKSKILIKNIEFLPMLLTKESLSIIKKFFNNKIPKVSFERNYELHSGSKKQLVSKCSKEYKYHIRHTSTNTDMCSKIKHSLQDEKKILLSMSGYLDPIYDDGKLGFTESQMYLLTKDKKFVDILNSVVYQFIFKICKWHGFNNDKIFKNIPYIKKEKDIDITLRLNINEIKFINKIMNNDKKVVKNNSDTEKHKSI